MSFLLANGGKAAAWAGVLGIPASRIPEYVGGLTPVVLRADTRVINHGYRDGTATARQSVLQAGTAVLVDEYGVPRVKCGCGNPLAEPTPTPAEARFVGDAWAGFDANGLVRVTPAARSVDRFTLIDVTTGYPFSRARGTAGSVDTDVAATPSTTTTPPPTTATIAPVPTAPVPAPQQPQVPVPSAPVITAVSSYTEGALVYVSVRFTDADGDAEGFGFNWSGLGEDSYTFANPSYGRVSPGRVDYPFNHRCGQGGEYESDVEFWISDSGGRRSTSIVAHLKCPVGGVG